MIRFNRDYAKRITSLAEKLDEVRSELEELSADVSEMSYSLHGNDYYAASELGTQLEDVSSDLEEMYDALIEASGKETVTKFNKKKHYDAVIEYFGGLRRESDRAKFIALCECEEDALHRNAERLCSEPDAVKIPEDILSARLYSIAQLLNNADDFMKRIRRNLDPRGQALKLDIEENVPFLQRDFGGEALLCV